MSTRSATIIRQTTYWGKTKSGRLPITISVYGIGWDEDYDVAMEREPIFSGTAYEYIERFGKEQ